MLGDEEYTITGYSYISSVFQAFTSVNQLSQWVTPINLSFSQVITLTRLSSLSQLNVWEQQNEVTSNSNILSRPDKSRGIRNYLAWQSALSYKTLNCVVNLWNTVNHCVCFDFTVRLYTVAVLHDAFQINCPDFTSFK